MPRSKKPDLYAALKATGAPITRSYVEYTNDLLIEELTAAGVDLAEIVYKPQPEPKPKPQKAEEAMPPFRWTPPSFLRRLPIFHR